jgi:hypothetical protein
VGSIPDFLSSPATVSNLTTLLDRSPVYVTSSENSFLTFVSFQTSTRPSRQQTDLPDINQTFQTSTRPYHFPTNAKICAMFIISFVTKRKHACTLKQEIEEYAYTKSRV